MRHMDIDAGLAFGADGATAVASVFNASWLTVRRVRAVRPGPRRTAAATLVLINAGVAAQAMFAQALYTAHRFHLPHDAFFSPGAWLASRAALLAGTLLLSLLILRRNGR